MHASQVLTNTRSSGSTPSVRNCTLQLAQVAENIKKPRPGEFSGDQEDGVMNSTLTKTALGGLLLSLAAATSMQATSASLPPASQQPPLMLAESGSDRLVQYREMQALRLQARTDDTSERFALMVEEEPTASGPQHSTDEAEPAKLSAPMQNSWIYRQRVEHGH